MAEVLQGTTPSLEIVIDDDDFAVSDVTALELTIRCGMMQTIYGLSDVTADTTANSFTYSFSQAETLAMEPKSVLWHQWRFKFADNSVVGTKKASISVADLMSEETL